jgi:uncharacterized protein YndB with AHSA1/START domain
MDADAGNSRSTVERTSDRELKVTRIINGPARLVFEAWTKPELFRRWWVPRSAGLTLLSIEMDVRVGGGYRLVFAAEPEPMAFFGRYLEVTPPSRLVWSNDEGGPDGPITSVTFEERGEQTFVVLHERHASKESLDAGLGAYDGIDETFAQLEEVLRS